MADGHGGYRQPAHPAPVSGPGQLARRTDGGPSQVRSAVPDQSYGTQTQQMNDQRTAPMAGQAPLPPPSPVPSGQASGGPGGPTAPAYGGGDFGAPSTRPNEPVTAGVPIGPGPGPSIAPAGVPAVTGQLTQMLQNLAGADMTGVLATLYQAANQYGV